MNYEMIKECSRLSDEEKITFPEVVQNLTKAGVESYYIDILSSKKTYYAENNAYILESSYHIEKVIQQDFDAEGVLKAIRQSQAGKIRYREFLKQIMRAGVISYLVFLRGRKAIYLGRDGQMHIENFPK